jgi:hypothetical protein
MARLELDRVLNAIDSPRALAIIIDDDGSIEMADKNLGPENCLLVLFSLAHELAQEIRSRQPVPEKPSHKPVIALPPEVERKLRLL